MKTRPIPPFTPTHVARFWAMVTKTDGCWIWDGAASNKGYGQVNPGRHSMSPALAHRVSWELANGPIPDGVCVLHRCDVRLCVRPDHLFLGGIAENNLDMARKRRGRRSKKNLPRGVYTVGRRYAAKLHGRGGGKYLGCFATAEEAGAAVERERAA